MFINIVALVKKCFDDKIFDVAAQMAYYLMLSFFPGILFVISMMSMRNIGIESVMKFFETMLPGVSYEMIYTIVGEALTKSNSQLASVGIVLVIYSASRGVRSLMRGLNKAYNHKESRGFISRMSLSFFFMIGLGIVILSSLSLVVLGEGIGKGIAQWLKLTQDFQILWNAYRISVALFVIFLLFFIIYLVLPAKRVHIIQVIPGAIIATLGWVGASAVFSFYVNNLSNYANIYGGLWAVIIFMIWIYLTSLVILIGGEVNSTMITKEEYLNENMS